MKLNRGLEKDLGYPAQPGEGNPRQIPNSRARETRKMDTQKVKERIELVVTNLSL